MEQQQLALTTDAPASAPRPVPTAAYPGGAARLLVSLPGWTAGTVLSSEGTKARFATCHRANRLMVIPTNGHRRPPETPT